MWNDNIKKWVDDLLTTTDAQVDGKLCEVEYRGDPVDGDPKRHVGYCCLGKGSTLVPKIEQFWPDDDYPDGGTVYFGARRAGQLAPREFMEWLGYNVSADVLASRTSEWDVFIDFPVDMRIRSGYDRNKSDVGGDRMNDMYGEFIRENMSCANLNDADFTFKQIGMLIKHFGLYDDLKPVRA